MSEWYQNLENKWGLYCNLFLFNFDIQVLQRPRLTTFDTSRILKSSYIADMAEDTNRVKKIY